MQAFNAKIIEAKTKGGAYIEIPFNVEEVYGAKRVKVIASFDGVLYRGSLVKMDTDCHIIGITKAIRQQIGKTIGDNVVVTLKKDIAPRIVEIPDELKSFLEQQSEYLQFWNSLSYSTQKKNIDLINSAKKEETRAKRLDALFQKIKNHEETIKK